MESHAMRLPVICGVIDRRILVNFRVSESESRFEVSLDSNDGGVAMNVVAELLNVWPSQSVFTSLTEASAFFEAGSLGYSPSSKEGRFQGLELKCSSWRVQALEV